MKKVETREDLRQYTAEIISRNANKAGFNEGIDAIVLAFEFFEKTLGKDVTLTFGQAIELIRETQKLAEINKKRAKKRGKKQTKKSKPRSTGSGSNKPSV